jgi:murein L,D-transpeptidase YcbB/YkuD
MADVEHFYRCDENVIDPVRLRFGIAYIVTNRVGVEFIYHTAWTRPSGSSGRHYTDNIYRLNIKIALNKGMLQRVFDGGAAED